MRGQLYEIRSGGHAHGSCSHKLNMMKVHGFATKTPIPLEGLVHKLVINMYKFRVAIRL